MGHVADDHVLSTKRMEITIYKDKPSYRELND